MRSFACPKELTSPATLEDQLGVTELQRAVRHCPDGLTMQPGFMAWSRTEKQLCWDREPGRGGVLSFTLLCHEALSAGKSHGPHSNLVAKAELSTTLRSPSSHCSQSIPSHNCRPRTQERYLKWIFLKFLLFLERKGKGHFLFGYKNKKHTRAESLDLCLHFYSFISTRILDPGEANSAPTP